MKTHVIAFNTGINYTRYGQRIAATRLPNGHIVFVDVDRGIDGIIKHDDLDLTHDVVLLAYRSNNYGRIMPNNPEGIDWDAYCALIKRLSAAAAAVLRVEVAA